MPRNGFRVNIHDGSVPFENGFGTYELQVVGSETVVNFTLSFDPKPDAQMPLEEVEKQFTDQVIPAMLAGLKHYVETGQPLPVPAPTS